MGESIKEKDKEDQDQDQAQFAQIDKAEKFRLKMISIDERISVLGKTGQGKSWFAAYLMHKFSKQVLTIVLDPKREYKLPPLPKNFMKLKSGLYRIYEIKRHGKTYDDFALLTEWLTKNAFRRGFCCIVLEEAGEYIPKHGRLYDTMPNLAKYLTQGRKRYCSLMITSQRTQDINTSLLSQSEHIICFKLASPHDLDAVKKYFDASWFRKLKDFQYLHYNINDTTVRRRFGLFTKDLIFGERLIGSDKKIPLKE